MHVLMISDVFFPRVNGVSTSIETFRNAFAPIGVRVSLVAPGYHGEPPVDAAHPWVSRIPSHRLPFDPEDRLMSYRRTGQRLQELHQHDPVDLVHIQTPFVAHYAGLRLARRKSVPVVATYHTLFEEYLHHYIPLLPRRWMQGLARGHSRNQCNEVDAVVVPSSAMRHRLQAYGVTAPMHVVPTGIPLERFRQGDGAAFRQRLGLSPEQPVALFVGRVAHEKNIGFLLDALIHTRRLTPDAILLIAGEGPARGTLESQARTLGLADHVRFVGYLGRQHDLPACYAAADAFVFASRTETQGLVLLEAMCMGLPVVALSVMGTADILAKGKGCVVPADNPQDFGHQLGLLLRDPARRQQLAAEARQYTGDWSDMAMAMRLRSLYRTLLGRY